MTNAVVEESCTNFHAVQLEFASLHDDNHTACSRRKKQRPWFRQRSSKDDPSWQPKKISSS